MKNGKTESLLEIKAGSLNMTMEISRLGLPQESADVKIKKSKDSTDLFEGGSSCQARIVPCQVDPAPRQNTFGGKRVHHGPATDLAA
jgi:hypothetical protein